MVWFGEKLFYVVKNNEQNMFQNKVRIFSEELKLKVVGNEKVGGSRTWHMIDIGLGAW